MSVALRPDFPVSPIVGRRTARHNRNCPNTNVYPYISTPVCGIPYAVGRDRTTVSGSSASRLGHDRRSVGLPRGQGQGPVLGAEKMVPATSTGRESGKKRTGGRTLSKSSPEARSGSKTSGEKSGSKGRSSESKAGENVETNKESLKRPVDNENSKNVLRQPKLNVRRPDKKVLQPVQNMDHDKQTSAVQSCDERERGKKSSQSSNPSSGKPSTDSQRLCRERKANTASSSAASSNLHASRSSSVAVSKSNKTQDSNSKAASTDSAAKSLGVTAGSRVSGAESALLVKAVEPDTSGRRFFKSPIKPSRLVKRVGRKLGKRSKTRGGSDRQVLTAKRQDQRDSVYDLNSSSESANQIVKQQRPLSALRKRRNEESAAGGSTSDNVGDGRQGHRAKRPRNRDLQVKCFYYDFS